MLDDDWGDYDMYEYFEDLKYGNDDYLDQEERFDEEAHVHAGDKRRRGQPGPGKKTDKRRRVQDFDYTPVLWLPVDDAYSLELQKPVDQKTLPKYALLPDWRERMKDAYGLMTATFTKPTKHVDKEHTMTVDGTEHEEADWEDEEDEEEEGEGEGEELEADEGMGEGLDPDLLKSILAAKGIGAADQDAFIQSLMQMMSGGGGASDDILGDLTSKLLGRVAGGGDDETTQWLTSQGVSLEIEDHADGNDEGLDTNDSEAQPPASVTKLLTKTDDTDSPKDSVAEDVAKDKLVISSNQSLPPASVPQRTPASNRKRKQVSFAPPDEDFSKPQPEEEEPALEARSNNKRPKRGLPASGTPSTGKLKSIKSQPIAKGIGADKISEPKPSTSETFKSVAEPIAELKVSRKRKAAAQEVDAPTGKPKKQPRSGGFAAPTASSQRKVSEPQPKTTRSGRKRE